MHIKSLVTIIWYALPVCHRHPDVDSAFKLLPFNELCNCCVSILLLYLKYYPFVNTGKNEVEKKTGEYFFQISR